MNMGWMDPSPSRSALDADVDAAAAGFDDPHSPEERARLVDGVHLNLHVALHAPAPRATRRLRRERLARSVASPRGPCGHRTPASEKETTALSFGM